MDKVVREAREWLGTPFHPQGVRKQIGCDCFGFILGVRASVYREPVIQMPPYKIDRPSIASCEQMFISKLELIAESATKLQPGCIVLFKANDTLLHCGIVNEHSFYHAQEQYSVIETRLTPKWQRRIARIYKFKE